MLVSFTNQIKVDVSILLLYTNNIQTYHQVKEVFLGYINIIEYCKQLALTCFICNFAFNKYLNISGFCYNICLY